MPSSHELQAEASGSVPSEDPRWQVIERIIASPCFQRSERLKAFLKYVAQQYLSGHADRLTGMQIGCAVFGKAAGHDQSEDNTVRIYARQLRLRLLEYFDTYGREEQIIIEIPKGSYVPVFRPAAHHSAELAIEEAAPEIELPPAPAHDIPARRASNAPLAWIVAGILGVALVFVLARSWRTSPSATSRDAAFELWPLSELASQDRETQIVLCDNSFALFQVAANHRFALSDYLKPDYPRNIMPNPPGQDSGIQDLLDQLGRKQITSYADAETAARIARLPLAGTWVTRPARDVKLREVQEGNYLFLGSQWANPWVELYEPKLNFVMTNNAPLGFINRHPQDGERALYVSEGRTGNMGDDYAAIAVIPNEKHGTVMIIQGTKEEGTEAAGMFMADAAGRNQLRKRLNVKASETGPIFFEALLRTKTFAGAPAATEVIAVRRVF